MSELSSVIAYVSQVRDGFKPIRDQADLYLASHSVEDGLGFATELYASDVYQARMMATIMLGPFRPDLPKHFAFFGQPLLGIQTGEPRRCWRWPLTCTARTAATRKPCR